MSNLINKAIKSIAVAAISFQIILSLGTYALAVNEDFDNANDDRISQNEQKTQLLSEDAPDLPEVHAAAYVLIDLDSGAILAGKDYDVQREPASTTKVMTLLLAMEKLNMEDIVTITPEIYAEIKKIPADYVKLGLQEGEQITVQDLVYAGALKSANDAMLALAMHISGTEAEFCNLMNQKAVEIGCQNTHFSSSFGYSYKDNLTTAYDLSMILGEAVTKTDYSKISTTYSYTIPATNKYSDSRHLNNANRFISKPQFSYDYYIGGKTGFTNGAGHTLVGAARKNDRTLVACVLKADDGGIRYVDLKNLFEYGFSHTTTVAVTADEFDNLISQTNAQISDLLVDTNLYQGSEEVSYSKYLTLPSSRASLGCTNQIELDNAVIDSSLSEQTLKLPLCKVYSDGTKYIVGSLQIDIMTKAPHVEVDPVKETGWTGLRHVLTVVAVITVLILVLVIALVILRHAIIRKRRAARHQSRPKKL